MGTDDSFPGIKRPGRVDDHSSPSNAEVKKTYNYKGVTKSFQTESITK